MAKNETSADKSAKALCYYDGFPRPYIALVNGEILRGKRGQELQYKTEAAALRAAVRALSSSDKDSRELELAEERGAVAWAWYVAGDDKFDVASMFEYRSDKPTEAAVIEAYVEGTRQEIARARREESKR